VEKISFIVNKLTNNQFLGKGQKETGMIGLCFKTIMPAGVCLT